MSENEDFEIEFLEEDADIVQQCVQGGLTENPNAGDVALKSSTLLIERVPAERSKKRKKKDEEDSDYDPTEDAIPRGRSTGRPNKKPKLRKLPRSVQFNSKQVETLSSSKKKYINKNDEISDRRKLNIQIPDYEDPLCLPVKSVKRDEGDVRRLKDWNKLCLNHFKHSDNSLKPDSGNSISSKRTFVLRNVKNKLTSKVETTIWSKTAVQNEKSVVKSEVFQCVLPKYREKKILTYNLTASKRHKPFHNKTEVILCKEEHKDGEALVVYKPQEALSAVYKLVEEPKGEVVVLNDEENKEPAEKRRYLKELTCCKLCTMCYQVSWRGSRKNDKKNVVCAVCGRTFVSVYNLLTHLRGHAPADVARHRRALCHNLARIIDYHYKCRVCQDTFSSIKALRRHLLTHKGTDVFLCEIGNHVTS